MNKITNNTLIKLFLISAGTVSLGIGILGIILPLLPTTPFLLFSAACYARSSEKFYNWLLTNRYFGNYIKNYREKKGIPKKVKISAIIFLWITISISIFIVEYLWLKILLLIIAISVSIHIWLLKTYKE